MPSPCLCRTGNISEQEVWEGLSKGGGGGVVVIGTFPRNLVKDTKGRGTSRRLGCQRDKESPRQS